VTRERAGDGGGMERGAVAGGMGELASGAGGEAGRLVFLPPPPFLHGGKPTDFGTAAEGGASGFLSWSVGKRRVQRSKRKIHRTTLNCLGWAYI
jgi:hypothetical protein